MALDVVDLREFYGSPLGQVVRELLRARIASFWPAVKGETILALGYATPLLRPWLTGETARLIAVMPDALGVAFWPREGPNVACLADLTRLPLPDEEFSRVVLLHALETASDPDGVLREVWRVLKPEGKALVLVPNRRGLWAHSDDTPFGAGRPYSSGQIKNLLREQGFEIVKARRALYWPAWRFKPLRVLAEPVERLCARLFPKHFGGLLVLEVRKQMYAPTLVKARASHRRLVLPLPLPT